MGIRLADSPLSVAVLLLLTVWLASASPAGRAAGWQALAPGMDLKVLPAHPPSPVGDSRITVVRIDPNLWDLEFAGRSRTGESEGRSAREWCKRHGLTACINAGMFGTDYRTHIGYLRFREHVNSGRVNDYQSVAAFEPRGKRLPRFRIFDLDAPGVTPRGILKDYASAVQNLRLIKRPGSNRWSQQNRKWSEAALGEDDAGRILFIFSRSPLSMHDLNQELLASGIGLVAAQHLEGGPEAQLYLHAGEVERELFGSHETSFKEDDGNGAPWPVPNVLGVRPRSSAR
jgi:Phosphodiester glycosidase